jgi:hypothetical protein
MTGNTDSTKLVDVDQLLLVLSIIIYPDTTEDKMATCIYNEGSSLYLKRLQELKISQKVASTEAYQAFTPQTCSRLTCFGHSHLFLIDATI